MTLMREAAGPLVAAALALTLAPVATVCATEPAPQPSSSSETQFASYAFASELGSGIYEISGRTIQVYQIPLSFPLRPAKLHQPPPGINLLLPLTVGFFNFQPDDVLHLHIPTDIGALSLEPGVQLDYWRSDQWHLYPYVKAGVTFASSAAVNALIYGMGIRSDYEFHQLGATGLWRAELNYAGVHYVDSSLPNDSFTRLRNGAQLPHNIGLWIGDRAVQLGPYGLIDIYFNAPSGPASGISAHTVQVETGLMLGVNPMWQVLGITLPRLGVGYRFAGDVSGWRLVIGDPF
jgi:hypothetical protein